MLDSLKCIEMEKRALSSTSTEIINSVYGPGQYFLGML